ncbi:hypothetical protein ACIBH1_45145 [Nonomuraea sp. NPDC050663]|uniref:hypothetical protein n=1 Tax=Nonomuraea sp. NPDC050663 TaxID=3364370 RepID=UPI0037A0655C
MSDLMTMTPGAIIGYRKSGAPIRLIGGGSEGAPEGGAGGAGDPAGAAGAGASSAGTAGPAVEDDPPANPNAKRVDELPTWAQKLVKDLRTEAADFRTQLADVKRQAETPPAGPSVEEISSQVRNDVAKQIADALGITTSEEAPPPDPEQVIAQLTADKQASDTQARQSAERHRMALVELAVHRISTRTGADPDALLDSRSFLSNIHGLDPDAAGFNDTLTAAITQAVNDNPKFAAAQAPAAQRSGGEFGGGPGGRSESDEPSVDDFRAKRRAKKE